MQLTLFIDASGQALEASEILSGARRSLTRDESKQQITIANEAFDAKCKTEGLRQCKGCNGYSILNRQLCSECTEDKSK